MLLCLKLIPGGMELLRFSRHAGIHSKPEICRSPRGEENPRDQSSAGREGGEEGGGWSTNNGSPKSSSWRHCRMPPQRTGSAVFEQCSPALILQDLVGGKEAAKEKDFQTLEQRVARARQRRISVCWVEGVPLVHTSALSEGRRLQGAALPRSHSLAISRKGRPEPCGTGLAK